MDKLFKEIVDWANDLIWNTPEQVPFLVFLLVGTGLFLTLRLAFVQVRRFGHGLAVVSGRYDNAKDAGDINHFQALSAALSATVGIGNIAGVATAIHYGGPGALFWMWITAALGMASKYAECTLAVHYRRINEDGSVSGGPMHYIEKGLGPKFKWLAIFFACCTIISSFGSGNSVQAFTVADSLRADMGIPTWASGLFSASLVALVILGGIKRIGQVASKLVPIMAAIYVLGALLVLGAHVSDIPAAFMTIIHSAFNPTAAIGGFAGSTLAFTLTWGIKRGLFSNEAGQGSAPIAHAAAKTDEPVREGVVALMEPFIDTLLICTMTGLVIVVTGVWNQKIESTFPLNAQTGARVVRVGAGVGPNATLSEADLTNGTFPVVDGRLRGAHLVINHALVDEALITRGQKPFSGSLSFQQSAITALEGTPDQGDLAVTGKTLQNGSPLTSRGFKEGLSWLFGFGHYVITICVFLFGVSTAISWSYYGDRGMEYLLGPKAVLPYRLFYVGVNFLGAIFSLEVVWGFGDAALGLMSIPNLLSLLLLSGTVARLTKDYFTRQRLSAQGRKTASQG